MHLRLMGLLAVFCALAFSSAARADIRDFRGIWVNTDRNTRGISRIFIRPRSRGVTIRAFGKCMPDDCDWGRTRAVAYADRVGGDERRDARALTALYDKGFANTTLIIRLTRDGKMRVRSFTRFKDGSGRANYMTTATFERRQKRPKRPRFREDCVPFSPDRLRVRYIRGGWKVVEGRQWLMDFGDSERNARRARRVINRYAFTQHCFVGRPNPAMVYFKAEQTIPAGAMPREDCIAFDPRFVEVRRVRGRWKITDGRQSIMDFGFRENEARDALFVIQRNRATRMCYVGRPKPGMSYLRR